MKRKHIRTATRLRILATPFVSIIAVVPAGLDLAVRTAVAVADLLIQHAIRLAVRPPKLAIQQQLRSDVFNR